MIAGKKFKLFLRVILCVIILLRTSSQLTFGINNLPFQDNSKYWFEEIYYNENNAFGIVEDIQQDTYGFVWIGTHDGLFRYDGIQFKPYYYNRTDTNSLSNNIVQDLLIDMDGRLWIATANGLNLYNDRLDQFTRFLISDTENSWGVNNFQKIAIDHKGNLWIASLGGGVIRLDNKTGSFSRFQGNERSQDQELSKNIRTVYVDKAGLVWIGSSNHGAYSYNPDSKEIKKLPSGDPDGKHLVGNDIRSIVEAPDGKIWIGTNGNGISIYDKEHATFIYCKNNPEDPESLGNNVIWNQFIDSGNNLWICTEGGGLNLYNPDNDTFKRFLFSYGKQGHISSNIVRVITEDNAGNLWIGNFNAPINYISLGRKPFSTLYNESGDDSKAGSNQITSILVDSYDEKWIGSDGGGIWRYNSSLSDPVVYVHVPGKSTSVQNNKPLCFAEDELGNIWIGLYLGGLSHFNRKENNFINYYPDGSNSKPKGKQVWDLLLDGDSLFLATEVGLEVLTISSRTFSSLPLEKSEKGNGAKGLWKIFKDSKNRLLAGTSNGLYIYDKHTNEYRYHKPDPANLLSLSEKWVLSIYEDRKERIWIGTNGGGLNLWNESEDIFSCFTTDEGLPSNVINSILEDDSGNLWLSTNNGLVRFNYDSLRITTYTKTDGLMNNRFYKNAAFKDKNGIMYFGSIGGLNYFLPEKITDNTFIPPVLITNVKLSNRPVDIHDPRSPVKENFHLVEEVHLTNEHPVITIEFSALNYTQPEENRYSYILKGFNEQWSEPSGINSVTYTNLPAGKYTFEVIASNNDNIWSKDPASFKIMVHPPFYKAWWFITLFCLLFLYMLFTIYKSHVTNVRTINTKLSELVADRTKELEERNYEIAQQNKEITEQRDLATSQRDQIQKQKEELEIHRNSLQCLVEERTNELMAAKEKAEENDKLKTAFLENLSHEIRTPMNAILGFMNLLAEKIDEPESRNYYMRIINESGKNMLRLIEDIIDFARMQTGDLKSELGECHATNLIRELTLNMREKASRENKPVNIINKLPDENVVMFTDEKKLRQIFSKLLENSFQNTNSGHISLGIIHLGEQYITFFVEDSGVGIDKKHLDRIFDRFFTVNEENVPKGMRGSGLGLAFAKTITEIMGGEIWVESKKSSGSTFYFTIPYLKVQPPDISTTKDASVKTYYWPDKTVLVAEDEESNFLLIEAMLRDTTINIIHVKDGIELLEKVDEKAEFDLVLLDLKMPRMGGLNAMKIIREHNDTVPVIIQTAYDHTHHRQKSIELGCDDFLIKPINKKELLEAVKKYLG